MKYKRQTRFGEGMLLAAVLLLCAVSIIAVSILNRPQREAIHSIHVLPEGFAEAAKININTATARELDELPGVGEALAQRIIDFRAASGGFENIEDIMLVDGIGEGIFSGMEDLITAGE